MITELISRTFAARDVAHREHWRTRSYSQHMALGEFYDAVIEHIDEIVECYQGEFGMVGDFSVQVVSVTNISAYLAAEMGWIQGNRDQLSSGSTSIQNLLDGLIGLYQRTLYKLNNLS